MKMNMLTLVPLCFLFGWVLPADSMRVPFRIHPPSANQSLYQLSMVEDSIDDMYFGCQQQMMGKVQTDYLKKEKKDKDFEKAWIASAKCAAEKKPRVEDKALTKDHIHAICVYTGDGVYGAFNEAVLTQRRSYSTTFKFHSLHFLLASAIQILNSDYHCHTSYRRTRVRFIGRVNQIVRFGSFASSSFRTNFTQFGSQTCFQIKTCLGAYLRHYSTFGDEEEVLIPPYETFRVTKLHTSPRVPEKLKDCKVVIELESAGAVSTLNCKAVNPQVTNDSQSSLPEAKQNKKLLPPRFLSVIKTE